MARVLRFKRQSVADLLDGTAILCSAACMVHCVVLPLLILALPVLAGSLAVPENAHIVLLALAAPAAGVALTLGYRRHRQHMPIIVGAIGLILLGAAALYEGALETWLTLAGSISIVSAHLHNLYLRQHCCGAA